MLIDVVNNLSILFFWVVTPCGLVGRYQRFGETYCLRPQGWIGGCFSETLVSSHESTLCHNPEEQHRHVRRRENLK
jgi:hypothetical protein